MKEKSYKTVTEKKILKILSTHPKLSKNKILTIAKVPRRRCADSLDALVKDQYLNLQNERYEITEHGITYLDEMMKRDKRARQSKRLISGRIH
jgi:predicted transcriptional regulator